MLAITILAILLLLVLVAVFLTELITLRTDGVRGNPKDPRLVRAVVPPNDVNFYVEYHYPSPLDLRLYLR